ncbi:MAG: T9SS type A sorting domain-containing protein, partial [Bacteroidales bacterium]
NGSTPNYTGQNVLITSTTVGTHTVRLKVTLQSGYTCELEQTINIPIQPIPNFTISTTNLMDSNTKSCEGREIKFTNTSNPLSNVAYAVWDFSDNTSLHAIHAAKVYGISNPSQNQEIKVVSLTVTDKHNCNYTTVHTVTIDKNNLSGNTIFGYYTLDSLTPPCYGQTVNVSVNLASNSSTPNAYQWYNETQPTVQTTVNNINVGNPGAYWVQLKDANYCYKNINPPPATVSFKYPVPAIITGKQNVCVGNSITLNAPGGSGLSYSWERDGYTVSTAQSFTENLPAGDYYYVLTLSQDGGCTSVSPPYHVTVHDLPSPPAIALSVVDCANYTLELSATGSGTNYTWSNGKSGSTIQVNSGGAYRVWLTDDYGCRNHADIDVPFSPATYFWRFPTGCYSYCPGELPKRVDGPAHIDFYKWTWLIDGSIVPYNGNYQGVGHNECDPLILSLPTIGSGSGDYSWMLYNGLCEQQSGIMNVEMKEECCDVVIKTVTIECKDDHYVLKLFVDNETPGCDSAFFNLYVLDSATNSPYILNPLIIPNMLIYGSNTITASLPFDTTMFNSAIVIKIETFCNSWEHCIGIFDTLLPDCKARNKSLTEQPTPGNAETKYVSELSILPNPANTEINIAYRFTNDNAANSRSIQVYDAMGRPVTEIKLSNAAGLYNLNVSKYAQGIYFVEIRENNQHILIKRIIIHH